MKKIVLLLFLFSMNLASADYYFREALLPIYGVSNPGSTNSTVPASSTSFTFDTNTMVGWKLQSGLLLGGSIKFQTTTANSPETDNKNNNYEFSSKLFLIGPTVGYLYKGFSALFSVFPFGSYSENTLYGTNPVIYDQKIEYKLSTAFQLAFGYGFDVFPHFKIGPEILLDWQAYSERSIVYKKGGTSTYDVKYETYKKDFNFIPVVSFTYEI